MKFRALSKLFNSSELKRVINGNFDHFSYICEDFPELLNARGMADFYNRAYELLIKNYRNEYVVKNEIVNKILLGRHSMKTTSMMSEVRTGGNIADCLIINGYSTCYEIKTEFDSLVRLKEQIKSYLRAYDKTYVVTHKSHLQHIVEMHNEFPHFGIIELTKRNQLRVIADAPLSTEFDYSMTFDTLRKAEYTYVAEKVFGGLPEMPNTSVYEYCKQAYFSLSKQGAQTIFNDSIKLFRSNDHSFINKLPKSLKNVGVSYQLSRQEKNSLVLLMTDSSTEMANVLSVYARKAS
ncbi:sce7726 family protein [Agarivorans sp. QJM3NY_29]|uniref:sce7726 family protein n=1 Tax=unclassified Agarivorans TaxID=2636026 RepID=UPI003D7D4FB9